MPQEGAGWCSKRKHNRWQIWNYGDFGFYFVTICTKGRIEHFGNAVEGVIKLNQNGTIAGKFIRDIEKHYSKVFVDEYIVMPNHVHAIILIADDGSVGTGQCPIQHAARVESRTGHCPVPTRHYGLLSKIINSYKNVATKTIHTSGLYDFAWQRSFYDHIIRTEAELKRIRQYILNNPINWFQDENNI